MCNFWKRINDFWHHKMHRITAEHDYKHLIKAPVGFVDLGLPSGLLWAEKQEEGYYTHEEAVKKYGEALPQPEEFVELWRVCKWDWDKKRKGYTVTGPNGKSIFLAASGYRNRASGDLYYVGSYGYYWSAAQYSAGYAYSLYFYSGGVYPLDYYYRADGFSVLQVRRSLLKTFARIYLDQHGWQSL